MEPSRFDLGLVTSDPLLIQRINDISKEFSYTVKTYSTIDEFLDSKFEQAVLVAFVRDEKNKNIAAELAQSAKHVDISSYVICGVESPLPKEAATFAKKSGADLILLEDELYNSSKLEFVISQVLRASYLPLKATDFTEGKKLPFDVFHLMPQRKKFIKFLFKNDTPNEAKIKKITEVGEVYVHRSNTSAYKKYIEEINDRTHTGLARRCRAQFMDLYSQYSNLALILTDQSERASFGEGEKLLNSCRSLCQELLGTLGEFSNAWDIINNSTIGEFGSMERAPAIAAYASLFSLQSGFSKIDDIMLVALLVDLGIIFLSPDITKKIRENRLSELTPEQFTSYRKYPQISMDLVLDRKVAMSEKMRTILISVHERADGKGFPKGLFAEKLHVEPQMIQFCKEFDQRTALRMGRARVNPEVVKEQILSEETLNTDRFTPDFLNSLRQATK